MSERQDPSPSPEIGKDEWVAQSGDRTEAHTGLRGTVNRLWDRLPPTARLAVVVIPAALLPLVNSDYVVRVGVNTIIYALLALGLNVVVGWAGLLDLGYVAFFGFGAYIYALVSSDQFDIHWPSVVSVPLVVVASCILGLLVGLPSRRLIGDYLAIVTLFFAQAFVTLVTNANRITPPGHHGPVDFTGGPNGIAGIDPLHIGGLALETVRQYYVFSLIVFAIIISLLYFANQSRTGRAWRALREDPLAAGLMGMPVNRLKLMAFVFGAGIAGFVGSIFVSLQVGVFPANFDISLLITIYAMVILGGAGSVGGVVLGAVTINVVLEVLRTPENARMAFYAVVLVAILAFMRPRLRALAVIAGTVALGYAVHAIVEAAWPGAVAGTAEGGGWLARWVDGWVPLLTHPDTTGNIAYAALILSVAFLSQLRGWWRTVALAPTLYLAAFVWENRLVANPSVTRLLLVGALLVALMNARPQGLLGTSRVEIA